ncbi:MAG TPA: TIGR02466 family protein [Steroidobacteraceae bacterium]|nr:TIGR02466 family protein [Steroidobacteraceae bacterium]
MAADGSTRHVFHGRLTASVSRRPSPIRQLFPTLLYSARLQRRASSSLNDRLLRECRQLRLDDRAGRQWSTQNYPGGYTSYGSASQMHRLSPTFAALQRLVDGHVQTFARTLGFDLGGRNLEMTDCWVNIMRRHGVHSLHLHPLSTLSGTYYVQVPKGSPGLKFEDPRLERFMAAPPRGARRRAAPGSLRPALPTRPWFVLPAQAGHLVLFESWLRHEVPPNRAAGERVSISFNYSWF